MDCPHCKSDNTTSFKMAWMAGSSTGRNESRGVAINLRGGLMVGGMSGRTNNQTMIAEQCAPPALKPLKTWGWVAMFFFVLLFLGPILSGDWASKIFGLVLIAPVVFFGSKAINKSNQKIRDENRQKIAQYESTWLCLRCGTKFVV